MYFTSLRRMKYALGIATDAKNHTLSGLVGAASSQIARYLRRRDQDGGDAIQLKSRTEYFDPIPGQRAFYPRAYPVTSITSIYSDQDGVYTGGETLAGSGDYLISSDRRSVVFSVTPLLPEWSGFPTVPRGVRVIYTGGLAADPVISSWTKSTDVGGTLSVGEFVYGESSQSVGYITARAAGTISIETLSGAFQAGETLKEYASWFFSLQNPEPRNPTGVTCTLTACTAPALCDVEPALVRACEMHVHYLLTNDGNFGNLNMVMDGGTRFSRSDLKNRYDFLPEIVSILQGYRNNLVAS